MAMAHAIIIIVIIIFRLLTTVRLDARMALHASVGGEDGCLTTGQIPSDEARHSNGNLRL